MGWPEKNRPAFFMNEHRFIKMETEHKRFKFFELVLIAAVLGSVGVTVIPQFTQAGDEDNIITLMGMLHQIRSQIDLYKAQHNGALPPGGKVEAFTAAMTQKGIDGFGPYMEEIPTNPFNQSSSVRIGSEPDQGAGTHGWYYNIATGDFYADDNKCHSQL
jgi:general secretion pathway protein G